MSLRFFLLLLKTSQAKSFKSIVISSLRQPDQAKCNGRQLLSNRAFKKEMVTSFYVVFTKVTSVNRDDAPPHEVICSGYAAFGGFPSKERYSGGCS